MNLVFLYGPPASGKLTIAKELAELTGYSLFHNHQTRDMVYGMYPASLQDNYELVHILRLDIFRYAAQHDTNLIFTFVYDSPDDLAFVQKVIDTVESEGGKVCFVETSASKEVLLDRVGNDSRKEHRKLTDKTILEEQIDEGRFESMPYDGIYKVDTSTSDPAKSAAMIAEHFGLLSK